MKLVCEYKGKIIAEGSARRYEEFYMVDLPGKYTEALTEEEFFNFFNENPCWKIAE